MDNFIHNSKTVILVLIFSMALSTCGIFEKLNRSITIKSSTFNFKKYKLNSSKLLDIFQSGILLLKNDKECQFENANVDVIYWVHVNQLEDDVDYCVTRDTNFMLKAFDIDYFSLITIDSSFVLIRDDLIVDSLFTYEGNYNLKVDYLYDTKNELIVTNINTNVSLCYNIVSDSISIFDKYCW